MKNGLFFGTLCFGLLVSISALDEKAVYEQGCKKDLPNPNLNITWFSSVQRWYIPVWSKLESYRTYSDVLNKEIKDLTEDEIKDSCINSDKEFKVHAFNATREDKYKVTFDNPSHTDLHYQGQKDHGLIGAYHIAKTDNQDYILGLTCWEDDQFTWDIVSAKPVVDPMIKMEAFEYLKTLGFTMEDKFIAENKYDDCKLE